MQQKLNMILVALNCVEYLYPWHLDNSFEAMVPRTQLKTYLLDYAH